MRLEADQRVDRFILARFREGEGRFFYADAARDHLYNCPDVSVEEGEAFDSVYGCDTGCEYVRFEAVITCPHGQRFDYEWGDFGELSYILDELFAMDA